MALNRLSEVRLNLSKFGQNTDTGELYFANRTWHYDTRYFDTSIATMKRVVVRVYAGDAKTKGNPVAESTGFLGSSLSTPGQSNSADWTTGSAAAPGGGGAGNTNPPGAPSTNPPAQNPSVPQTQPPLPNPNPPPTP
jgi:hypothetical protein